MKNNDLYLIAYYTAKPRDPRMTKVSGYMKDPANIIYDERVEFAVGLKSRDQTASSVIVNLTKRQIMKNRLNPEAGFEDVIKYYCEAYPEYMEKAGFTLEKDIPDAVDVQPVQAEEEKSS